MYPRQRENYGFWRRFLVTSIIIFPSLGIALAVPGKSSDIVTATGDICPSPYAPHIVFELMPHNNDDDSAVLGMSRLRWESLLTSCPQPFAAAACVTRSDTVLL